MEQETESPDELNQTNTVIINVAETEVIQFDSICRLCANQSERIIGIYSEEGIAHELAFKMNLYLPIKVSEEDTLPLQCCWNCASTVLAWHELVVGTVEADRRLREIQVIASKQILESVDEEPNKIQVITEYEPESTAASLSVFCESPPGNGTHPEVEDDEVTYQMEDSGDLRIGDDDNAEVIEGDADSLKKIDFKVLKPQDLHQTLEVDVDEEGGEEKEIMESCSPEMIVPDDVVMQKFESGQLIETKSVEDDQMKLENANGRQCTMKIEEKEDVEGIEWTEKDNQTEMYNFACQYCSFEFITEDDILQHVKEKHADEIYVCGTVFQPGDKKARKKHTKIDHEAVKAAKIVVDGRIYYNCKVCGKSLYSPYTYMWHTRIHTGERPYVCDLCGKQFRVSQGLVRHLKETHEGIKNFPCDLCGRMFATRRNVEEHRRIHTNERPYVCDLCGKSFKQKASLFVHSRSHTDYFPYRCSYCSQGFRTRPPLLVHITRHTGEKPYPCDICGRCFRIKYELKRHRLVHSDEKPFVCGECGLSFRQKRYLRNHNKTNHNRS